MPPPVDVLEANPCVEEDRFAEVAFGTVLEELLETEVVLRLVLFACGPTVAVRAFGLAKLIELLVGWTDVLLIWPAGT